MDSNDGTPLSDRDRTHNAGLLCLLAGCSRLRRGETEQETRENLRDALNAHFEAMRGIGEAIPEPSSSVDYVDVTA